VRPIPSMTRTLVCLNAWVSSCMFPACAAETEPMPPPEDFVLTFADEFDGAEGSLPDLAVWKLDLGTGPNGDGWGNGELQFYTGRPENVSLDGEGHLRIVARAESFGSREYTSARLRTQDNFEQRYGRFEARIRVPSGQGLWPAFWMLGNDFPDAESTSEEARRGQWPGCGEIDVMEVRGQAPNVVAGTIHGPGYSGGESITESLVVEDPALDEDFHVFAVEWDPGRIAWFVDDRLYHVATTAQVRSLAPLPGATDPEWVFDHPFFLILNLAVGGGYVGPPDATTPFPATLLVDYVRVYRRAE
jgi:beta-glucanase (GH16 family)